MLISRWLASIREQIIIDELLRFHQRRDFWIKFVIEARLTSTPCNSLAIKNRCESLRVFNSIYCGFMSRSKIMFRLHQKQILLKLRILMNIMIVFLLIDYWNFPIRLFLNIDFPLSLKGARIWYFTEFYEADGFSTSLILINFWRDSLNVRELSRRKWCKLRACHFFWLHLFFLMIDY